MKTIDWLITTVDEESAKIMMSHLVVPEVSLLIEYAREDPNELLSAVDLGLKAVLEAGLKKFLFKTLIRRWNGLLKSNIPTWRKSVLMRKYLVGTTTKSSTKVE